MLRFAIGSVLMAALTISFGCKGSDAEKGGNPIIKEGPPADKGPKMIPLPSAPGAPGGPKPQ